MFLRLLQRHKSAAWLTLAVLAFSFIPVHACLTGTDCACCDDVARADASSCCSDEPATASTADSNSDDCCIVSGIEADSVLPPQNTSPVKPIVTLASSDLRQSVVSEGRKPSFRFTSLSPPVEPRIHILNCQFLL